MSSMNEERTDALGLPVLFNGGLGSGGTEVGNYTYAEGHPKFGQEFDPADHPRNRPPVPPPTGMSMMQPRGGGGIGNIRQQMFNRQQQIRTPPWLMQQNQRFQPMQQMQRPRPYGGGPGFAKPLSPNPGASQQGGAGGAPTSWKMSIEPMASGGMIPGYQDGGSTGPAITDPNRLLT